MLSCWMYIFSLFSCGFYRAWFKKVYFIYGSICCVHRVENMLMISRFILVLFFCITELKQWFSLTILLQDQNYWISSGTCMYIRPWSHVCILINYNFFLSVNFNHGKSRYVSHYFVFHQRILRFWGSIAKYNVQ